MENIQIINRLQGFRASGLQGFRASGLQGFRASGLQGFRASRVIACSIYFMIISKLLRTTFLPRAG